MTQFAVQEGDVIKVPSDLLFLKFAQSFYGADQAVATRLINSGVCTAAELAVAPGNFVIVDTKGAIAPKRVLFLGTPPLARFEYNEMEVFARKGIEKIAGLNLPVRFMTTTVHGTGYGLDGEEALQRLVKGFRDGLTQQDFIGIERITFLTLEKRQERMLARALRAVKEESQDNIDLKESKGSAGARSGKTVSSHPSTSRSSKKRVFVVMPFSEDFQNVYQYGIYPAVRRCGLICERVDKTHFVGDILGKIKGSIEAAVLVVADLTGGKPNVYLEVGYAWGKEVPVIFLARKGTKLPFDVKTHRCIFYGAFPTLRKDLEGLIRGIEIARTE